MADITALEHATLKVPYEVLNKRFRLGQKTLDREIYHVTNAVNELEKVLGTENKKKGQISNLIGGVIEKLSSFKRKADEATQDELESGRLIKRRVDHIKEHNSKSPAIVSQWKKIRVDRIICEYLLRAGYFNTALELVKRRNIDYVSNVNVFIVAHEVEESLRKKDPVQCLLWCHDNKSKLKKINSTLEFNIRLQEFIELIKQERRMDAIWFARKYFGGTDHLQLQSIQQCMALIAFPSNTDISPYKELLCDTRWNKLIEQFREDNLKMFQIASQSSFSVVLQAGLSALKTPNCYRGHVSYNPNCPVCNPNLNTLASTLPYSHCSQSRLVCFISGDHMNEHNQPLMLPNGYVYGQKALKQMAKKNNGFVVCPRTHNTFSLVNAEKVYVM